jgi:hypothetical protein
MAVSKGFFDSISPGDDFEIHKTKVRKVFLQLIIMKSGMKYKNPEIIKSKSK